MGNTVDCKQIVAEKGAIVIDVRSPEEFKAGHVEGSKNIPLGEISTKAAMIKSWDKPVVLCCLSGGRAGQAKQVLESEGVEVYNAGGWKNLC
ncbi:rhodanese-like domain-containing protein [Aureibacter tunicatorum]|uniref:Rhodanese-related sulfurtransferase n=1 Tax=Aureibacter tunicatorum TaxID=866807 RepID=A0AAE3XRZ0_9BACT|nr:rhodanese-like domain-containing protein [Aureibacter tunicatorum]MDR6240998.1 rhodanese-related sulfurtransferase [Aureibacter tunicatorum]BDD03777.1 hypothetical protein AUTU_12600 [Aureibacter tunicatorum]